VRKETLDKDLDKFGKLGEAAGFLSRGLVAPGLALLFLSLSAIAAAVFAFGQPYVVIVVVAAAVAGYMALNIGANDVTNNVGPAVGARAITMSGALLLAAVCEIAGALIAGSDVVTTISEGIVDRSSVADPDIFVRLMLAALFSAALWIHLSTWIGAPVSTTHSIVGAVFGAGLGAAGASAIDWPTVASIAGGWIFAPFIGALFAVAILFVLKTCLIYQDDKLAAAQRWVPLFIALMAGPFAAYLATKGLRQFMSVPTAQVVAIGIGVFGLSWALAAVQVRRQARSLTNHNQSLRQLFHFPLICSAALMSFAHGANDVSNAVGPLAAIVDTILHHDVAETVAIPRWVMLIGAFGISAGLLLYGPRLIRIVGAEITRLNPMRAFAVALATATTVIVASWLGLPVSSTHIVVGAVFGVGFFREWYTANSTRRRAYMERRMLRRQQAREAAGITAADQQPPARDKKAPRSEVRRRSLVRRAHVRTIAAAWFTTVPAAALLAVVTYHLIDLIW